MGKLVYCPLTEEIPDLKGYKSVELVFSGKSSGKASEERKAGMESVKRIVSSGAFPVLLLTGVTDVSVREHDAFWLVDHIAEPGSPLVILTGEKEPQGALASAQRGVSIREYLTKIR